MSENKGMLDNFTPGQTFTIGLVGSVLLICTVGFFILLGIFLKGTNNSGTNNVVANNPTNPTINNNPQVAEKITVRSIDLNKDHIRGNKNATISIVEYSDAQCPFCSRFQDTMNQVIAKYGEKVRWVYRHFPLDQLHPSARTEANAAECAGAQGKFWEFLDKLYADQTNAPNNLAQYAGEVGINVSKFNDCVSRQTYSDKVKADETDAVATGGQGTPHSILIGPNGETEKIDGALPFATIESMIQKYTK